jgi:hypothetical protein
MDIWWGIDSGINEGNAAIVGGVRRVLGCRRDLHFDRSYEEDDCRLAMAH